MGKKAVVVVRTKPKPSANTKHQWKPSGAFPFFELPREIRDLIYHHVLHDQGPHSSKDVVNMLLVSYPMFSEVAAIFYREVILDSTQLSDAPAAVGSGSGSGGRMDPFLSGPTTRVTTRQHVRVLEFNFRMRDQLHLFRTGYGPKLDEMACEGNLEVLQLHIASRWPSGGFWGGGTTLHQMVVAPSSAAGGGDGDGDDTAAATRQFAAPMFVAKPAFQDFLRFLKESRVAKIRLYVDGYDHYEFWCPFHAGSAEGGAGKDGCEAGRDKRVLVSWRKAVKGLLGARVIPGAKAVYS